MLVVVDGGGCDDEHITSVSHTLRLPRRCLAMRRRNRVPSPVTRLEDHFGYFPYIVSVDLPYRVSRNKK